MLHADIAQFVREGYIDHPLVAGNRRGTNSINDGMANRIYEYKLRMLEIAKAEGNMFSWIMLHQPGYRVNAFLEVAEQMPKQQLYMVMGEMWTDPSLPGVSPCAFCEWFRNEPERLMFMNRIEATECQNLPLRSVAYRACSEENAIGVSWTRSLAKAKAMKILLGGSQILTAVIDRDSVFAFINRRNQDELVLFPENARQINAEVYEDVSCNRPQKKE